MASSNKNTAPAASIGLVFSAAEDDGANRAYAGLTLLSQVCVEEGMQNVKEMSPALLLFPNKRVGLRPPQNDEREKLFESNNTASCTSSDPKNGTGKKQQNRPTSSHVGPLPNPLPKASGYSCRSVYVHYCEAYGVKCNSGVKAMLCDMEDDFSMTALDFSGNFIGDRGILPILEVMRLCPNFRTLKAPLNGLKNSGVEYIVHYALTAPHATSLAEIDLSGNRITLGAGKILIELVQKRKNIKVVNVEGTRIDDGLMERLQKELGKNQ